MSDSTNMITEYKKRAHPFFLSESMNCLVSLSTSMYSDSSCMMSSDARPFGGGEAAKRIVSQGLHNP